MDEIQYEDEINSENDMIRENINLALQSEEIQMLMKKIGLTEDEILYDLNLRETFGVGDSIDVTEISKKYMHYVVYMKLLENFRVRISKEQQQEIPEAEEEFAEEFSDLDEKLDADGMLDATIKYGIFPYITEDGIIPVPMQEKQKKEFQRYVEKMKTLLNQFLENIDFSYVYLGIHQDDSFGYKEDDEIPFQHGEDSLSDAFEEQLSADIDVEATFTEAQDTYEYEEDISEIEEPILQDDIEEMELGVAPAEETSLFTNDLQSELESVVAEELNDNKGIARLGNVLNTIINARTAELGINKDKTAEKAKDSLQH